MQIASPDWDRLIIEGAEALDIKLTPKAIRGFGRHAQELLIWNRRMNLTRIVDPMDLAVRHMVDSLALVPHLPEGRIVADIGSGGGFPGIPIKLSRPDLHLTLIESIGKKVSFLKHTVRILGLEGIHIVQARAESAVTDQDLKGRFDVVIFRALASLWECFVLSIPFLRQDGMMLAMKAAKAGDEIRQLEDLMRKSDSGPLRDMKKKARISLYPYQLPKMEGERAVVKITLEEGI